VQPLHVATWIEGQTRTHAAPTVKQRLAAIRHLFDWLVTGQIVATNPAGSVRGPAHRVKTGKTPVLEAEEARRLLDSIDTRTPAGLRDRALMALMVYSFARIGAALGMKVEDAYTPASFGLPEPPDLFEYLPMTAPRDALVGQFVRELTPTTAPARPTWRRCCPVPPALTCTASRPVWSRNGKPAMPKRCCAGRSRHRAHRRLPPRRPTCPRTPLCTRRTSCPATSNSP